MELLNIFLALFMAHFIADFPLQGDFLAQMKGKNNYLLFCHCMIYTAIICLVLWAAGIYTLWKFILLVISHFAIDYWKCHFTSKETALTLSLYIDQGFHFTVLLFLLI